MRKSFLTATAIVSLTLAPAVWAQQRGEGGGAAPGAGGAPGAGAQSPGGSHGDMRSPGGESGGPRGEAPQPGGGMRQGAGDDMRGDKAKGAERDRGDASKGAERDQNTTKGAERDQDKTKGGERDRNDATKGAERDRGETTKGAERDRDAREPGQREGAREHGGGAASLSTEQKTRVRSGFHGASVREARDIAITHVTIGASIPRKVVEYWEPVPASIIEVVPAWRAYKVVRVHDEILVIDPDTFEIVYIL
ncbi:Protein of unknown function [Rhodoblastus acidophilus]|uniref:DUF1236 domain-containing protein n=1 Tax=Rhodoblastus acidophilus TaxID=1074 RepID=A0A212QY77_RHOAC|nr:DUF1236 domain-containing protein [Rhodoblastus acidophilus]SNB64687.1 Protein of unknown function [Rhodoblastus acidophilus]